MFTLAALLDWATSHSIDLDNCRINVNPSKVTATFQQGENTAKNLRALKRALGKLEPKGYAPYVRLEGQARIEGQSPFELKVSIEGAFECEYTCKPARPGAGRIMNELSGGAIPETFTEDELKRAIADNEQADELLNVR